MQFAGKTTLQLWQSGQCLPMEGGTDWKEPQVASGGKYKYSTSEFWWKSHGCIN